MFARQLFRVENHGCPKCGTGRQSRFLDYGDDQGQTIICLNCGATLWTLEDGWIAELTTISKAIEQAKEVWILIYSYIDQIEDIWVFEDRKDAEKCWERDTGISWISNIRNPSLYREAFKDSDDDYELHHGYFYPSGDIRVR